MPDATRIDAHHHHWDLAQRDQPWIDDAMSAIRRDFSMDDLVAASAAAGVTRSVVVHTLAVLAETEELLELGEQHAMIAGVVGWLDLTADSVADDVARLQQLAAGGRLVGIRHLVQAEPADWLRRPDVRRGLRTLGDAGLSFDLLTLPHQLAAALDAVRVADGTTFVVDHCSKPAIRSGEIDEWAEQLREISREPNTWCKLSGLTTEADWARWSVDDLRPYVDVVLEAFGPDRLMFGSDWPVCLLATDYTGWVAAVDDLTAGLSPDEQRSLWHGAASAAYRLTDPTGGAR